MLAASRGHRLGRFASPFILPLGLLCLCPGVAAGVQTAPPPARAATVDRAWGFDRTDLQPDPRIRFGVLANGMRYAIMPNRYPAGGASLRLHVAAGSTSEGPGEAGYAHLLEHMAFRGTRNLPGGESIQGLEALGVGFGSHFNAFTSLNNTIYVSDLTRLDGGRVDAVLRFFREVASEITLSPASLEGEKSVVLEEMRAHDAVTRRRYAAENTFFAPNAAIARGPVIGTAESVRAADPTRLRQFYERHYRPHNLTVIVVGDVDVGAVEARIRTLFNDWRAGSSDAPNTTRAEFDRGRGDAFQLLAEPYMPTQVSIASLRPLPPVNDTSAVRDRVLPENLAFQMLTRRLARSATRGNATFSGGRASSYNYEGVAWIARIDIDARDRDWRAAVQAAEHELRRALTFGFTASELREQVAVFRQSVREATGPQQNRTLAADLVRAAEGAIVLTPPGPPPVGADRLGAIDLVAVNNAFRAAWADRPRLVFASHDDPNVTVDHVRAAWSESRASVPSPPSEEPVPSFAYQDFGAPGAIVRDRRGGRLGVRTVRFANNVRLNVLRTDTEARRIHVSLRVGGGLLALPAEPEGLATFMGSIFAAAGTGRHDAAELRSIFAGREVRGGLEVEDDAFAARRVTNEQDLRAQLAVLAAYVTDPGYRPEAERRWQGAAGSYLAALGNSSEGVLTRDVSKILSGDRRLGVGSPEHMRNLTFASLRPAVADALARGAIEIGIVGDVDEERAVAAVAATFGALPARRTSRPAAAPYDRLRVQQRSETITLTHGGRAEDARIGVYWPTAVADGARSRAEIELLAAVLRIEISETLRVQMGATYGPSVSWFHSPGAPDFQYLSAVVTASPANLDTIFQSTDAIARSLASEPVNAALLARARNPLMERLRQDRQSNERLLDLVARAQSSPGAIDRLDGMLEYLPSLTAADVRRTARRYLRPDAAVRIRVVPATR
jgi:zinc protease